MRVINLRGAYRHDMYVGANRYWCVGFEATRALLLFPAKAKIEPQPRVGLHSALVILGHPTVTISHHRAYYV